jgi:RNA polymerase sigma factor (sigma-70 family)
MNSMRTRLALAQLRRSFHESANKQTDIDLLARFVAGDEDAFAVLVHRHGRMVLGVCRGVLHNRADAEDAFQAVFVALARKASHPFSGACLGAWLHTVARRASVKLRNSEARRRLCERDAGERELSPPSGHAELREVLDEEVSRLPASCREAILRCYFHGQTRVQAAGQLGWSLRTLDRRLEQGRQILRERLTARGTSLGVLLAVAPAAVPSALADVTVRAALGEAPARVAKLAGAALSGLTFLRGRIVFACLLLLGLAAGSVFALLPRTTPPVRAASAPPVQRAAAPPPIEEPLPEGALARLGSTRFLYGIIAYSLAYSKDGKILASAGRGRGLCLWDAQTGRLLHHCTTPQRWTISLSVSLSPDGQYAACDLGRTVRLWSLKTGKDVRQFSGHANQVNSVAYSPRGDLLASGSDDRTVRLWDPNTGRQLHLLEGHGAAVYALAFRHDGKVLASGSTDGIIRLWNPSTGALLHVCKGHDKTILKLVFEPAGKHLISTGIDGSARVWNSDTGNLERTLVTGKGPVRGLVFAPDGKTIAGSFEDRSLRLLDFATGKELRRWYPDCVRANCLAWSPDGKTLASGATFDSTIHLWDPQTGKERTPRTGHCGPVMFLAFHDDGRRLLSLGFDTRLLDWDLATKTSRPLHSGISIAILWAHVALTPDGKYLASAGRKETETTIRLFDTATGKEERSFTGPAKGSRGLAFSPRGERLASASQDGILRLWRTRTGELLWHTKVDVPVGGISGIRKSLVFSPDGASLAYFAEDNVLRLFDAARGKLIRTYSDRRLAIHSLAWSPDNSLIALSGQGPNSIILWNVLTGEVSRSWQGLKGGAWAVGFSPDGRLLASAEADGDYAIHLWEVASGGEVAAFRGHVFPPETLAFSPDGRRLVSGGYDSLINIWDVTGRVANGKLRTDPVSAVRFAPLWEKLGAAHAKTGHAALWDLVAGGNAVVPMLKARLSAAKPLDDRSAARIVAELDGDDYATRTKATKEAAQLGLGAEPALCKALGARPGLEPRRRFDALVAGWLGSSDWLRYQRAVAVLEYIGGADAKEILTSLARGAEGARPTQEAAAALARLRDRR